MELGLLQVWHNSRLTMFRYVTYNKNKAFKSAGGCVTGLK